MKVHTTKHEKHRSHQGFQKHEINKNYYMDVGAAEHLNEQMHSGLSHSRLEFPLLSMCRFPKIAPLVEMRNIAASEQV